MSEVKYKIENMNYSELKMRATLPKFQRQLVWSKREKDEFIETLKNGNPFGSILIYKYIDKDKYSIIDGLQRFSTMDDYKTNPQNYVKGLEDFIDKILIAIDKNPDNLDLNRRRYQTIIKDVIDFIFKEKGNPDSNLSNLLYKKCKGEIPLISEEMDKLFEFSSIQDDMLKYVDEYLDIEKITIPCIVFLGDESELAEVFQNLNRGGRKLNKYQVFAAQWSEQELKLNELNYNNKILEIVINRYLNLQKDRGIEITDFDDNTMRVKKRLTFQSFVMPWVI